jgi:uncharacterized glyoxalase superfamily protein PhnB
MPKPIPDGFHTITPHLIIKGVSKAIDFYKKAFGAEEIHCLSTPDGRILHAHIKIGDSNIFLADEFPEAGCGGLSPQSLKNSHATMHIYVTDVDTVFERAVTAGATVTMPVQNMFWGDRYGQIVDPFGQPWSIGTHIEDVTPEEMQKRSAEACKQMAAMKK